ncbi:MAG TPA: APC family permease [Candidatus Methylomirabilis sp.]|nr:APC family permease [Candidatus Methylomirabilis sp.]
MSSRLRRELGFISLLAVLFFNVSGGPYGIEDTVGVFGPGLVLVLLVVTPFLWSLPVGLVMAELASALPEEGGYVAWVRRAFGPFWGFQVGWWSWVNSFVDVAVFPALFADYLRFWWPGMSTIERWTVVLAFVWVLTGLNLAGVRVTGWIASALGVAVLAPVAVLTVIAAAQAQRLPWVPFMNERQGLVTGLGLGLATMMWNYSGWDTPTMCLGETRSPTTTFPRVVRVALPVIVLGYVLPVAAALSATGDWSEWRTGYLPVVAQVVGGSWLAGFVMLGALLASAGLFLSLLLTNSRLPFVLAVEGQMPAALARVHPRFGTPWVSVIVSSACYSIFAYWSFKELIVLDIWLYSLTLVLELAAFVALRLREPGLPRPWRVGGGMPGMWMVAAVPAGCGLFAMATAGWTNTLVGVAAAITGPIVYCASRFRRDAG